MIGFALISLAIANANIAIAPPVDDVTAAIALRLLDDGHRMLPNATDADIVIRVNSAADGTVVDVSSSRTFDAARSNGLVQKIAPAPIAVMRLEAAQLASTLVREVVEGQKVLPTKALPTKVLPTKVLPTKVLPSTKRDSSTATGVVIQIKDRRRGPDLARVRRRVASRLLGGGYALAPVRTKGDLVVCVELGDDDVAISAAPVGALACSSPQTEERGTAAAGEQLISAIADAALTRVDAALAKPESFALAGNQTSVPYGDGRTANANGDDESFVDQFAPRRVFISGQAGLNARAQQLDPTIFAMVRTEHGRRLGLGVVVQGTHASNPFVTVEEATALVGLTYAIDLEVGFEAVLGAFGGGRAHIFALQDARLVPANDARDGVLAEFLVAALMAVRYRVTPTLAVEAALLFSFGTARDYGTEQLSLWQREAAGISATIGLSWELPVLEGATEDARSTSTAR